jgi:hypothetical protein
MSNTGYVGGGSEIIDIDPRFRKLKQWAAELSLAARVAADYGGDVSVSDSAYQIGKVVGSDYRIVIYPHKTSAGNYHARVRDENSKNKSRANEVMSALDRAAGFNCTFSRLNA